MKNKPRNLGTMTNAAFYGRVRSALRKAFQWWEPAKAAKKLARRPVSKGRQKWEYHCAACGGWFKGSEVQVDHIVPCGSLRCDDDIAPFLNRLTPEDPTAFQVLCKPCHQRKTAEERKKR